MSLDRNASTRSELSKLIYEEGKNKDAQYTMNDEDLVIGDKTYPSLKKLYISFGDPVDAVFARSVLGNLGIWLDLLSSVRWGPIVRNWKYELELKIKSDALQIIIAESRDDRSKNAYAAAKFLVEGGWATELKVAGKAPVGRPKKESEDEEETKAFQIKIKDDFARLLSVPHKHPTGMSKAPNTNN